MKKPSDRGESEARARILWGEEPERVLSDLVKAGWDFEEIESAISEAMSDRRGEIRRRAWKRTAIGTILMAAGSGILVAAVNGGASGQKSGGAGLFLIFLGLWQFLNGAMALWLPDGERGCITEMDED